MAPQVPRAELNLGYPIYSSDFDPDHDSYLLVGGGGGEGRSGVGNKITLIDTSRPSKLQQVRDIDLSRDEDSVTSLAIARSASNTATVFAGINSSVKQQEKGVNEHLRSFKLTYGSDTDTEKIPPPQPVGKSALFAASPGSLETYQRVLRLSRGSDSQRLGAVATGLAPCGEIVVFDAAKDIPSRADIRQRIKLQKGEEAADLDLLVEKDVCKLVYCTDYEVSICNVGQKEPTTLYTVPQNSKGRPKFRAVRFLTAKLLALVSNLPSRTGSEVILMEIPEDLAHGGSVLLRKRLHRAIKSATSLATAFLPASAKEQNVQHVLAIAGQDISITIVTLDHAPSSLRSLRLKKFTLLKDVHPVQMTSLAFSNFVPPKDTRTAPAQHLKLASTSMDGSVIVHTLPLATYPPFGKDQRRYCLTSPVGRAEIGQISMSILITLAMAAIGAVLIQALTEIRGGSPDYLGAKNWLSQSLYEKIAVPYMFAEAPVVASSMPPLEKARDSMTSGAEAVQSAIPGAEDILAPLPDDVKQAILDWKSPETESKPLILHDTSEGLAAESHHDEAVLAEKGRKWEDLEHHERKAWKKKLAHAGSWAEGELETVLKGVFFGELAGVVAGAIRG